MSKPSDFVTLSEFRRKSQIGRVISLFTLQRYCRDGVLPAVKIGKFWMVSPELVEKTLFDGGANLSLRRVRK